MLFKSNKFFDLKTKKALVKLVIQKLISLKTCDHTVEYWQLSINLCQFFKFFFCMLQVTAITFWDLTTWKCVISLYTYIYVKQGFVTHIFSLFLTKHLELAQFLLFCNYIQGSNYRVALRKLRSEFLLLWQKCFTEHEKCKAVFLF